MGSLLMGSRWQATDGPHSLWALLDHVLDQGLRHFGGTRSAGWGWSRDSFAVLAVLDLTLPLEHALRRIMEEREDVAVVALVTRMERRWCSVLTGLFGGLAARACRLAGAHVLGLREKCEALRIGTGWAADILLMEDARVIGVGRRRLARAGLLWITTLPAAAKIAYESLGLPTRAGHG